jgi:hypothetical protein
MAKRLQVILQDSDYREVQRAARARHMSIAEWVRQSLEFARRREPVGDVSRKLQIVRAAARNSFPTADIGQMLAEIEAGYLPQNPTQTQPQEQP